MRLTPEIRDLMKKVPRVAHALQAARILEDVMLHYYHKDYAVSWDETEDNPAGAVKLEVDQLCDALARQYLTTLYPLSETWGFVGEESFYNSERGKEFFWCVDPICGSMGYKKKTDNFGTSIALFHDGRPILGVMNCPIYQWTGVALADEKLVLCNRRFQTTKGRLNLIISANRKGDDKQNAFIEKLAPDNVSYAESLPVKSLGLVMGEYDLFYGLPRSLDGGSYKIWDIGATAAFAEAAGLFLTDAFGKPVPLNEDFYRFNDGIIMCRDEKFLKRSVEITEALIREAGISEAHAAPGVKRPPRRYFVRGLQCVKCGKESDEKPGLLTCPDCGIEGIMDVIYDYDAAGSVLGGKALSENPDPSHWRWAPIMPVKDLDKLPPLRIGASPLYQAPELAGELGLGELWLKDDGLNPTGSLKDRASSLGVARALYEKAAGVTCASTGNAASSLAGSAAAVGLPAYIFVPGKAPEAKLAQLKIFGSRVFVVEGSYEDAFELSMFCAERFGFYNRNSGINPFLVEGKKTVTLEAVEQMEWRVPDYVFVAVGDGCTLAAVWKGFVELEILGLTEKKPVVVGVQAEGADPVMTAWKNSADMIPVAPATLADSIAVGTPRNWIKAVRAVRESGGYFLGVTDDEILEAMRVLGARRGVFAEPAGAAGFAGLKKAARGGRVPSNSSVLAIISGNGLKDAASAIRAAGEPRRIPPDKAALERIIQNERH